MKSIINNKYFGIKDIKHLPQIIFWGVWLGTALGITGIFTYYWFFN